MQPPNASLPTEPIQSFGRIYYLDAARAILMLLGIPYHAAVIYVLNTQSDGREVAATAFLYDLAAFIHSFRMPAFFLIAGFFAALILQRRAPGIWFQGRVLRLGLPLLVGLLLLSPAEMALRHWPTGDIPQTWDDFAPTWLSYLWFLPELIMLSAAAALLWQPLFARGRLMQSRLFVAIALHQKPLWMMAAVIGCWTVTLYGYHFVTGVEFNFLWGFIDIHRTMFHAPYFLLGMVACMDSRMLDRLTRFDAGSLALAAIAVTIYTLSWEEDTRTQIVATQFSGAIAALCVTQALLAWTRMALCRPNPLVRKLVDASFSIYLLHYPLVALLALLLTDLALPMLVKWAAVTGGVLLLSYFGHLAIARSPLLMLLFNGVPLPRGRQSAPETSVQSR